ncbi:hypothetical protein [uncultured Megasphaera sp.]|uniref:hypothetical protein n=1 Tax=uncultured Megasphaera sp. TaxID=165188 RepID=UPI0025E96354|nr:hypothetical protein [uncultured Megasphaera sp.]
MRLPSPEMEKLSKLWDEAKTREEREKITQQMIELDKKERKELGITDEWEL